MAQPLLVDGGVEPYNTRAMKTGVGHLARWGLLVTAAVMGAALLATSWASYRSVQRASQTLARGQGEAIAQSVMQVLSRGGGPPSPDDLESVLQYQAVVGLRYVAILDAEARPMAEAGKRMGPLPDVGGRPPGPEPQLVDLGPRFQMLFHLPPRRDRPRPGELRRPGGGPRPPRRPPRPPDGRGGPRPLERPAVVIEFEPLMANQLAEHAVHNLGWSALAALALALATAVFWRFLRQREETERRLEHERRLRALGEMSAVLAHEIRNPVASLKGHAQLLAERLDDGGRERRNAERVVAEAKRLETLASDLLDFCRTGPLDRRPADPAALLAAAAESVDASRVRVVRGGAPESWPLDASRIRQVLTNLLRNACQASPEGRPVEAGVALERGRLVFAVRDYGQGIPAGDEERIFEPFYTTRARGSGLGLGVARRIVEMHGGTITAESHPEGGARFTVSIPAA